MAFGRDEKGNSLDNLLALSSLPSCLFRFAKNVKKRRCYGYLGNEERNSVAYPLPF